MKLATTRPTREYREPMRTLTEMAEEFGVSPQRLRNVITAHGGPGPELKHEGHLSRGQTWHKPSELRKWWRELNWKPKGQQ